MFTWKFEASTKIFMKRRNFWINQGKCLKNSSRIPKQYLSLFTFFKTSAKLRSLICYSEKCSSVFIFDILNVICRTKDAIFFATWSWVWAVWKCKLKLDLNKRGWFVNYVTEKLRWTEKLDSKRGEGFKTRRCVCVYHENHDENGQELING